MTMIRVNPRELDGSAEVLRSCAVRLNEIGHTLAGCVVPTIPPELEAAALTLARVADNALQRVAGELDRSAADLRRRAAVAATDLAAAAGVATPGSVGATATGSVVLIPIKSWELTSLPGAQAVIPITVRSTGLTSMSGAGGVIPITLKPTGLESRPGADGTASTAVNRAGLASLPGSSAVGPTSERPIRLTEAEANRMLEYSILGVTPGAMLIDAIGKQSRVMPKLLAPTQLEWENKLGYRVTESQYHQAVPEALPIYGPYI